jgi:hypothetical protein
MSLLHSLIITLSAKQIKAFCDFLESNRLKNDLLFLLMCGT